jgi:GTP cyclohydrolase I
MTEKEKAKDLVNTFYYALPNNGSQEGLNSTTSRYKEGVRCALIAVNEMIKELEELLEEDERPSAGVYYLWEYYKKVQQELDLL